MEAFPTDLLKKEHAREPLEPCMIIENVNIARTTLLQIRRGDGDHQEGPLVKRTTMRLRL